MVPPAAIWDHRTIDSKMSKLTIAVVFIAILIRKVTGPSLLAKMTRDYCCGLFSYQHALAHHVNVSKTIADRRPSSGHGIAFDSVLHHRPAFAAYRLASVNNDRACPHPELLFKSRWLCTAAQCCLDMGAVVVVFSDTLCRA